MTVVSAANYLINADLNAQIVNNPFLGVKQRFHEITYNNKGDLLTDFYAQNNRRVNNIIFDNEKYI